MKIRRILFALDLDENLFSISLDEETPDKIRRSAEFTLSEINTLGYQEQPELLPGQYGHLLRALSYDEWKKFFQMAADYNERFLNRSQEETPLINFIILTSAHYDRSCIMTILKNMYGEDLIDKLFPALFQTTNFFNALDQKSLIEVCDKGKFLDKIWPDLEYIFGLRSRQDLRLVDDNERNISSVEAHGFQGTINPTCGLTANMRFFPDYNYTLKYLFAQITTSCEVIYFEAMSRGIAGLNTMPSVP